MFPGKAFPGKSGFHCSVSLEWPVLIVVPASVSYNWACEVEKWIPTLPTKRISVVRGLSDVGPFKPGAADVIIMTYALFKVTASPLSICF